MSAVHYSDDDRFLAASMWRARQDYERTMLFEIDGLDLRPRHAFGPESEIPVQRTTPSRFGPDRIFGTPTGVLLHNGYVITRLHESEPEGHDVILFHRLPVEIKIRAANSNQHQTHNRVIVVRNTAITEAGGTRGLLSLQGNTYYVPVPSAEGLALRRLDAPEGPLDVIPVMDCPRITAIAALPDSDGFVTGGSRGEVDRWAWNDAWSQHRLRGPAEPKSVTFPDIAWATYAPESIVGLVFLSKTHELVAATRTPHATAPVGDESWTARRRLYVLHDLWTC